MYISDINIKIDEIFNFLLIEKHCSYRYLMRHDILRSNKYFIIDTNHNKDLYTNE